MQNFRVKRDYEHYVRKCPVDWLAFSFLTLLVGENNGRINVRQSLLMVLFGYSCVFMVFGGFTLIPFMFVDLYHKLLGMPSPEMVGGSWVVAIPLLIILLVWRASSFSDKL